MGDVLYIQQGDDQRTTELRSRLADRAACSHTRGESGARAPVLGEGLRQGGQGVRRLAIEAGEPAGTAYTHHCGGFDHLLGLEPSLLAATEFTVPGTAPRAGTVLAPLISDS